jgi:UDP-N-acetylmuramoyl-tripeptide--D-alanyl-D-alanine ligase
MLLRPNLTVVTSIGSEHHGSLGSLEVTRAEKVRMIAAMPASGITVLNGDDPNVLWMRPMLERGWGRHRVIM